MNMDIETPKQQIEAWAAQHGVTMAAEFVPFSQSRNKGEKSPSLNWRVTIKRDGRDIRTTDYSAGCGHCPSSKIVVEGGAYHRKNIKERNIAEECETGKAGINCPNKGKALLPDLADVLYSLSMDSSVLDAGGFESWASDYEYDTDSRKAEDIYRACLDIALKLRSGLGETALQELCEACQDY